MNWRVYLGAKRRNGQLETYVVDLRYPDGTRRRLSLDTADRDEALGALADWKTQQLPRIQRHYDLEHRDARPDPLLRTLIDDFVTKHLPNLGRAPKTISKADQELFEFQRFCAGRNIGRVSQLSLRLIDEYQAFLRAEGLSPRTVRNRLAMIRAMLNASVERETIAASPIKKWFLPKIADVERFAPTPLEVGQILAIIGEHAPDYLNIVSWIALTGNREGDAIHLQRTQVDLKNRFVIRTQEKTKFLHKYEISAAAAAVIRNELNRGIRSPYLFTDARGNPFTANRLYHQFTRALKRAGFHRHVTIHDLRHAFATNMVNDPDNPCPLPKMQQYLGHRRIETTMRYQHNVESHTYVDRYGVAITENQSTRGAPIKIRRKNNA